MDFELAVATLNSLLRRKRPAKLDSSWIRKNAPRCYRFIQKNVRRENGGIDWDRVTYALDRCFQRLWRPRRIGKQPVLYEDRVEVQRILNKYRDKLYVFIAASDKNDRRIRDVIGISLVRLAQSGNLLARLRLMELLSHTIDDWIERHYRVSRWRGYGEEMQEQLEACIRRYRYTGSFLTYLFRTLEYAARGLVRPRVCSIDQVPETWISLV
jgi:hypothetical protein